MSPEIQHDFGIGCHGELILLDIVLRQIEMSGEQTTGIGIIYSPIHLIQSLATATGTGPDQGCCLRCCLFHHFGATDRYYDQSQQTAKNKQETENAFFHSIPP